MVENLDVDECTLGIHQCPSNSKCINKLGWYRCQCNDGYEDRSNLIDSNSMDLECHGKNYSDFNIFNCNFK